MISNRVKGLFVHTVTLHAVRFWRRVDRRFLVVSLCLSGFVAGSLFPVCKAYSLPNPSYDFTVIADNVTSDYRSFGNMVSLNNQGWMGFKGACDQFGFNSALAITDGDTIVTIADTRTSSFTSFPNALGINDLNEVAFRGHQGSTPGIYKFDGTNLVNIDQGAYSYTDAIGVSINNSGDVAFKLTHSVATGGVSVGDGIALHEYVSSSDGFSSIGYDPVINDSGVVAFFAQTKGTIDTGIYIADGNNIDPVVTSDQWTFDNNTTINNRGEVAFIGTSPTGEYGLYRYDSSGVSLMVDDAGAFAHFGDTVSDYGSTFSLNNSGDLAFFAELDQGVRGIFLGSDLSEDTVVLAGDTIQGHTINELILGPDGFNDKGQIAFLALTSEGQAIILATPIPEPSSFLIFALLMSFLQAHRGLSRSSDEHTDDSTRLA